MPDDQHQAPQTTDDAQHAQRIRAAWIYHVEGKTQSEVAQELGINRVAVTRLLSEARRRGEVTIGITSALADVVALERAVEKHFALRRAVIAPNTASGADPTRLIAAAAGRHVSDILRPDMTVGVGWGRTLHAMLDFLTPRHIEALRVISLLGGISEAKRFNPAEFAWAFAELFDAEGFLIPAPALVDSPVTRHALLERCGLDQIFQIAERSDVALISCGGLSQITTSYRLGHVTEAEREQLAEISAVGDVLYNFLDAEGRPVDHSINRRAMSIDLDRLRKVDDRILISGGPEKLAILRATIASLRPTTLITDELTARSLLDGPGP
ncbi:MAG: sugar-binding transcriptional regulator [Pseudomonadota bacterium]